MRIGVNVFPPADLALRSQRHPSRKWSEAECAVGAAVKRKRPSTAHFGAVGPYICGWD